MAITAAIPSPANAGTTALTLPAAPVLSGRALEVALALELPKLPADAILPVT